MRSLSLDAALAGGVLAQRAARLVPSLPPLPPLPEIPSIDVSAPFALLGRALDHVGSFRLRASGLWVPAAPALAGRSSPGPGAGSGFAAGRMRPDMWAGALDLDGLAAFLKARHPVKTAAHVSALTGEPIDTVRKWLRLETRPGLRATIILVCVYELPLIEACLRRHPDWMVRAREEAGRHALAAELRAFLPRIDSALGMAA